MITRDPGLDLDLIDAIYAHRLKGRDIERILSVLGTGDRQYLIRQTGELLHRAVALEQVSEGVNEAQSLDLLLPRLVEILTDTLGAERSSLFLHDSETDELFARVAEGEGVGEIRFPADQGIAGAVLASGTGLVIGDAYADPRFNRQVDRETGFHTRDILCAPIRLKGQTIGVTQVLNKRVGGFEEDDLRLLEALNAQAAAALDNAHLYERVARARREEAQLLEVTSAIASELNIDALLSKIIAATSEMLDAERSSLFLHDAESDELWSRIAEGLEVREIRFPSGAGIAGACFSDALVINIPDAYADPRFNPDVDRKTGYRTRSVLCMPVANKQGATLGVIQVLNKRGGPFTGIDERRLRAFSAQAAIALENARLFDAVLNERNYNESILKSLSNGVLTLNAARKVIKVNAAALRILNRERGELLDRPIDEIFPEPGNAWLLDGLGKVAASGASDLALETELVLAGDATASVNLTTVPLIDIEDRSIGYMLVFEDITSERRMRSTMARYMTKEVADRLLAGGQEALGGQSQVATVLFSDIRNFTGISERIGARETVAMLNEYFTDMIEVIFSHRGTLDKYIGDAIMALFGTPFPRDDDADNALAVANEMVRVLRQFNAGRSERGKSVLDMGIGISTGELVAGNIGSPKRMDYTVIGDTVNLASRLEGATKIYGVKVLFSEATAEALQRPTRYREIDLIRVKGKQEPVVIYESLDHYRDDFPNMDQTLAAYERGLHSYFNGQWQRAAGYFDEALSYNPDDKPSRLCRGRCEHYIKAPPPPGWDGVWTMQTK